MPPSLVHNLRDVAGTLHLDGCSLEDVVSRFGSPLFVGSRARIEDNVGRFFKAFAGYGAPTILSYSTKTNSNLGVLQVIERTGAYAGVCSGLDFCAARRAGFPPARIVFDGLAKTQAELEEAIGAGVGLINAESWEELARIDAIGRARGTVVPVGLRVRLGPLPMQRLSAKSLIGISYARFGFDLAGGAFHDILDRVGGLAHVRVAGLHVHEGSHYRTAAPYIGNFRRVFPLVQAMSAKWPGAFTYLNLGGGLGVERIKPYGAWDVVRNTMRQMAGAATNYDLSGDRLDIGAIGRDISAEVTRTFGEARLPLPSLVLEPGRFVVGDAFVLVCRIVLRKTVPGAGTWLVLDAGTNVIPLLTGFTEHHQAVPVTSRPGAATEIVNLAGPLMYSSDVLMKNYRLPTMDAGALVALLDVGAYTLGYSNQFLYPRPAAVLLEPAGARVIRERETYDTVLAQDRTAP